MHTRLKSALGNQIRYRSLRARRGDKPRRCVVEAMESRRLLSVTLSGTATTITDIETTGPFGSGDGAPGGYAVVNGSPSNSLAASFGKMVDSYSFAQYEVSEFQPSSAVFPGTYQLSDLTQFSLQLWNTATSGEYAGDPGPFNVYLIPNSETTTPTSSLTFQSGDVNGLNGQGGTGANTLLGTFNFTNDVQGYDTFTLSSIPTSVGQAILTALNYNQTFRLAITPGAPNFAADWNANYVSSQGVNESPIFSFTGDAVPSEQFALSAASYTVNETAGAAEFSVVRNGYTGDSATVNYATSNGSALAGTNYAATSGMLNFAAGQTVGVFSVPISDVAPQGGNKSFTVTLGSPTATSATASLGGQASAAETIVDATPLTNNLSAATSSVTDIETAGPYYQSFAPVNGSISNGGGSFGYLSYEVLEFSPSASPSLYPALGFQVQSLQNLSLQLFNTDNTAGTNYDGHPGNFDIYFIPNSEAATPTSSLTFQAADVQGLNGQGGTGLATLLGTFSFSNAATGYDTYTPASLSASIANAVVSDLNSQTPFRLAVTPQTTNFAADWDGNFPGAQPILSLTAAQTQVAIPEYLAFGAPSYSISETGGTETITVNRTGSTVDTASVNYATSDGTAIAGTNYLATSGILTFAPGQSSANIVVPINDVPDQGGDKALLLTLSNPSNNNPGYIAALGSPSTAILTISDSNNTASNTETLTQYSADQSTIQTSGPYPLTTVKIVGTASSYAYSSFGALDFNNASVTGPNGPDSFNPAGTVTAINSITLSVYNATGGSTGPVDVYLVSDATSDIDPDGLSPLAFTTQSLPEGLGIQLGTKTLLGSFVWNANTAANTQVQIPLTNYSPAAEQTLINDLNGGTKFRIVITPETSSVYADWGNGIFNGTVQTPQLSFNVTEGTPPQFATLDTISANASGDAIWLRQDGSNIDWFLNGSTTPIYQLPIDDPNGLTINGDGGTDTITLDYSAGDPLPAMLHLNGTFFLNNFPSTGDPLAGHTIDIGGGTVFISYAGGSDPLSLVQKYLRAGYANGTWTGSGDAITSSSAAANHQFTIGYADSADKSGVNTFANSVELKYTVPGDTNLDGSVNFSDLVALAQHYGGLASVWDQGDFNYDAKVNFTDLVALAQNYDKSVTSAVAAADLAASQAPSSPSGDAFTSAVMDANPASGKSKRRVRPSAWRRDRMR